MKFDFKNLKISNNCIEIKRKGITYWRIFLFRANITDFEIIQSIPSLMCKLNQKMKILTQSVQYSIELNDSSLLFFYLTRDSEPVNIIHLTEFRKIIYNCFGNKIDELTNDDIQKAFWGLFSRNTWFSNIKFDENCFKLLIKDRILHLAIFSIKDIKILTSILDLIASLKIKKFELYFNNNLESNSEIRIILSIASQTFDKIQEFYAIISSNFPRETISIYLPKKSLFVQYLFKFFGSNLFVKFTSSGFHPLFYPQKFLKSLGFEEVRPLIFIHKQKLVSVIILRKINLRLVKFYLKTYYGKYLLVFWILNPKLFNILDKNTKLQYLQNCRMHYKKKDTSFWEKTLQLDSEYS